MGYSSSFKNDYTLAMDGSGVGVRMVYSCIGYGVMSFWAAFVFANKGSWQKKTGWILGGLTALWIINILRVGLLLLATHKHWPIPFSWDHHTWFNIFAYALIFIMIYFYDRSNKKNSVTAENKTAY
jgi:exosortase/archaeosortase family protein